MQFNDAKYIIFIAIWCLVLGFYIRYSANKSQALENREKRIVQNGIYYISIAILVFDLLIFTLTGYDSILLNRIIRIISCILYFLRYLYALFFTMFLMKYTKRNVLIKKILLISSAFIGLAGMICLFLPQVSEDLYYFDDTNYFYYGRTGMAVRVLFMLDMLVMLAALWIEKKYYRKGTFCLYLGFVINLVLMGLLDYIMYTWYLQNMAIYFSTIIIFIDNSMRVSDEWLVMRSELLVSEYKASHDSMTGLWNKTNGLEQIKRILENMSPRDILVLGFVDIDDFKRVNDTYGHEVGDFWIREVAAQLQEICTPEDVVCRYGGDEFIIFLKNISHTNEVIQRMDKFKESMHNKSAEKEQDVHCSIGLYVVKGAGKTLAECVLMADSLLYNAKENGKDTYVIGDK